MVQQLVGLGPQLSGVVGGQRRQLTAQLVQRPPQGFAEDGHQLGVSRGEGVVGPPVGEGHDGADELLPVPYGRGGQVDGDRLSGLVPQHLPADAVLAPAAQGVGERGLLEGEGGAVGAGVLDEAVQFAVAEVGGAVAEDLGGGRVDQHHPSVGVGAHDALGGGAQDHLGLALRAGQLGLGVHGLREVADHEHQQLVARVRGLRLAVGVASVEMGARELDGELGAVGTARGHPLGFGAAAVVLAGPAHGAGDQLGVELGQEVEHAPADEPGTGALHDLERDRIGVDDRAVGVDEQQRVRKSVEYCCEASSASGWPAAHDELPP